MNAGRAPTTLVWFAVTLEVSSGERSPKPRAQTRDRDELALNSSRVNDLQASVDTTRSRH
jgi:hypothetical protein